MINSHSIITFKIAAPAAAPMHCTTTYATAFSSFIPPDAKNPTVTAGLMWQPLTCPIH